MEYQVEVLMMNGEWRPSQFFVTGPRFATRAQAEAGVAQVVENLNSPEHPEFDANSIVRIVELSQQPEVILFLSDARGIYIPQNFAEQIVRGCVTGVDSDVWEILEAGPEHEAYWDAWTEVLDGAIVRDEAKGIEYFVHQDGDCWLIPRGMEWDDNDACFVWPQEDEVSE